MGNQSEESFIDIDLDHEGKATLKYIKELDKRLDAFKRAFLWAAANDLYEAVTGKIPKNREYARLIKAMKLAETRGQKQPIFSVYADSKARAVRKIDEPHTVIYVRARRISDRTNPDIKLLSEMGPWTVDTIPFWPTAKQAIVIQRRVTKKQVEKVAKMQESQKNKVQRALQGIKNYNQNKEQKRLVKKRKARAVPDFVYQMTSLEFGGGKTRPMAIWRNALLAIKTSLVKTITDRYKRVNMILADTRSGNWRTWPTVKNRLPASQLKSFEDFQKKLGYG